MTGEALARGLAGGEGLAMGDVGAGGADGVCTVGSGLSCILFYPKSLLFCHPPIETKCLLHISLKFNPK